MKKFFKGKSESCVVAAFDFDGTITRSDTLTWFFPFVVGWPKTLLKFFCLIPWFLGYAVRLLSRQQMKEKILVAFFRGKNAKDLAALGRRFAEEVLPSKVKSDALQRIRWHQEEGHRLVLVSAGLEVYLKPWAEKVGFQDVLATALQVSPEGTATGKIQGMNCWGREKRRRIEALLGDRKDYTLYAYGDGGGDAALLAFADHPFYRTMPAAPSAVAVKGAV